MTLDQLDYASKDAPLMQIDNKFINICPTCSTDVTSGKWLDGVTDYICTTYYRCKCGQICRCVN